MSPGDLRHIYEIEEGLEHRILSKIQNSSSFYSFMEALKTKRYTWTRLQRACTHILTNTTKEDIRSANIEQHAPYIRLLGMSQKGQTYLSKNKKKNRTSNPYSYKNIRPCRFRYREKKQTLYISPSCTNRYAHNY